MATRLVSRGCISASVVSLLFAVPAESQVWSVWRGYNPKPRYAPGPPTPACVEVGVQNLSPTQARAVLEAADDVCRVLAGPAFADSVRSQTWLASCERPGGRPDSIAADSVVALMRGRRFALSVQPRKPRLAWGLTDRSDTLAIRVAIAPGSISQNAGDLRATFAHELTHVASGRFKDRGNGRGCSQDDLVSYGVQEIVETLWLAERRAGAGAAPADTARSGPAAGDAGGRPGAAVPGPLLGPPGVDVKRVTILWERTSAHRYPSGASAPAHRPDPRAG